MAGGNHDATAHTLQCSVCQCKSGQCGLRHKEAKEVTLFQLSCLRLLSGPVFALSYRFSLLAAYTIGFIPVFPPY